MAQSYTEGLNDWLRSVEITDEMRDILRKGHAKLADWHNIACGYGANVHFLSSRGMVRRVGIDWDPEDGTYVTTYKITDKGREELNRARLALLAAIGVHEVHSPFARAPDL